MFTSKVKNLALAAGLILTSTAFIAGTTLLAKALGTGALGPALHPLQNSHGRFVFAFLALASVAAVLRPCIEAPHWGFIWAGRCLAGAACR